MDQPTVLVGVREIAEYLRRGPKVVRRMIRDSQLPVSLEQGAYMTTTTALDAWLSDRALNVYGHKKTVSGHEKIVKS